MKLTMNSLANSAGIMRYKKAHFDIVRPGIILYGGLPSTDFLNPPTLTECYDILLQCYTGKEG